MMEYREVLQLLEARFGKDCQFALATAADGCPSVRFVDTCYFNGGFYIVTNVASKKARQIQANPNVSLASRRMHTFSGKAYLVGHPLKPQNAQVRERLVEAFRPWYFRHNDESDANMCYIRVDPEEGFFHQDGVGYRVDFFNGTSAEFPFMFDIQFTAD